MPCSVVFSSVHTTSMPLCVRVCVYVCVCNTQDLETAVIDTIKAGKMTKDLAICVHNTTKVTPDQYLNTEPFMDAIVETFAALRANQGGGSSSGASSP